MFNGVKGLRGFMTFIAESWLGTALLGLAAASVPIILHFLFKSRYKTVPWAAMKFLRLSIEQTSKRIQFQELLLLLLRVLMILLLALAVLRPKWGGSSSGTEPIDAAFVLDSSISMDAKGGDGKTRFEHSLAAAQKILDALPEHSTVQIYHAGKKAYLLGPAAASNREQARAVLREAAVSQESGDMLPALEMAGEWLKRSTNSQKQLLVFSDMQFTGWDAQSAAIQSQLSAVTRMAQVWLCQPTVTNLERNATLGQLQMQAAWPSVGERIPYTITLRNSGKQTLGSVGLKLTVDGKKEEADATSISGLQPGEVRSVTLTARFDRAGNHIVAAELDADDLASDNRLEMLLEVKPEIRVIVLDAAFNDAAPEKSSSFYLAHAIRPGTGSEESALRFSINPLQSTEPNLLGDAMLVILTGLERKEQLPSPETQERLKKFVQAGGVLLFAPGAKASADALSNLSWLPGKAGDWVILPSEKPAHFDAASIPSSSFLSPFLFPPLDKITQASHFGYQTLTPTEEAETLLRFTTAQPALLAKKLGAGLVLQAAFPCDLSSSEFPLRPTFVPFIQGLVRHLLDHQSGIRNYHAGDVVQQRLPVDQVKDRFELLRPGSSFAEKLGKPTIQNDLPLLAIINASRAGVYYINKENSPSNFETERLQNSLPFVIQPDVTELADLSTLSSKQLEERLGVATRFATAGDNILSEWKEGTTGKEWTTSVLWFILLCIVVELVMAWFCGRAI